MSRKVSGGYAGGVTQGYIEVRRLFLAISRIQVELELKRILESEIFAGGKHAAPEKLGQLLTHIVIGTLDGISLTENALLIDFYGYEPAELNADRHDARIGALRLRKKLGQYNATAGAEDAIVIDIPKGQYKAVFSENPSSPARKQVRLGFHHVNEETHKHIYRALDHFEKAVELQPDLADGWAGIATTHLTFALHAFSDNFDTPLLRAEAAAEKARSLDEKCWRAHAELGSVYLFRHEWQKADAAFEKAKQIAPLEIFEIASYGPYLLSRGYYDEARKLARHYQEEGFDDAVLLCRAGLILYVLREFDQSKETLLGACKLNRNFWRCHLLLAFVYLSLDDPEKAFEEMEEVRYCARGGMWLGMEVLCLEAAGQSEEAEKAFGGLQMLRGEHYQSATQLGLGFLGLRDMEQAISCLSEACDASDPFTAWLHLWPLLDPLRNHRRFRDLIRKWKFPSPYSDPLRPEPF